MADLAFVALTLAFFGVCALYVRGCERIVASAHDDTIEEAPDGR